MPTANLLIAQDAAQCLCCGKKRLVLSTLPLCEPCALSLCRLRLSTAHLCPRCLVRVKPGKACPLCARDPERLIERTFSPYPYRETARALVIALKFHEDQRAAALLAPAMRDALGGEVFDLIVPVPLHEKRLKERGFNQAGILAQLVGRLSGIQFMDALTRTRATERQSSIQNASARQKNVADAFTIAKNSAVQAKSVLLVDDVRTTGATALACAKALRVGGAAKVCLLTATVGLAGGKKYILRK